MLLVMMYGPGSPLSVIGGVVVFLALWVFIIVDAVQMARARRDVFEPKRYNRWYVYVGVVVLFLFVLQPVLQNLVRSRWVEAFRLPNDSMAPTLRAGDYVLARKAVPVNIRDRIVVFRVPFDETRIYLKRAVGLAGDTVQMANKVLIRNGKRVDERYVQHVDPDNDVYAPAMYWQRAAKVDADSTEYQPTRDNWGPLVVPPNHIFMLGDNRDDSEDSRYWGFVPLQLLVGYPKRIYFAHEKTIQWNRIGKDVVAW